MEWTLGQSSDDRGNRRFFTIASSPTEHTVRLGVKIYEPESTFKRALLALKIGDVILLRVLPETLSCRKKEKLVFIAGGIGVTLPQSGTVPDGYKRYAHRHTSLFKQDSFRDCL